MLMDSVVPDGFDVVTVEKSVDIVPVYAAQHPRWSSARDSMQGSEECILNTINNHGYSVLRSVG